MELSSWLEEHSTGTIWYVKRLSGNDTLANGSHQAGPYVPKALSFSLFPSIRNRTDNNADAWFQLFVDSHSDARDARIVWYNNRLRGGTRDELRITNLGGKNSALLDPESTGALSIFAFQRPDAGKDAACCNVWVCRNGVEEDIVELETGPVEPGQWTTWPREDHLLRQARTALDRDCRLQRDQFPQEWLGSFPSGAEIIQKAIEIRSDVNRPVDARLIRRRECEFQLFQSLEEAVEMPRVRAGFDNIADFLAAAQSVLQRRKARSGRSLELHVREILLEESFVENQDFTYQPKAGNNPDFLFPNETAYLDPSFPRERLRMLAVKTTLRDRWRQVTEECSDLPERFLLTLQEGVSENQFRLISDAGIRLVVPRVRIAKYAKNIRPHILTIESLLADLRTA